LPGQLFFAEFRTDPREPDFLDRLVAPPLLARAGAQTMPRPSNGYVNAAGQPIPGTHDPIKRYEDKEALMAWTYNQGKQGLPRFQRAAIDIGATVHAMAELDLKGRPHREIEACLHERLAAPNHLQMAWASFGQFQAWRQECEVRAIAQETPLISETYQYGGTPDTIAMINGGIGLIDFKASKAPYPSNLVAMAAHGQLWNETHPDQKIDTYHLLILPKEGGDFQHYAFDDLSVQWRLFLLWFEAYKLDKIAASAFSAPKKAKAKADAAPTSKRQKPPPVKETPATTSAAEALVKALHDYQKDEYDAPSAKALPKHSQPLSMAEMLRSYGHVPEYTR
jgi:hypothetical protein